MRAERTLELMVSGLEASSAPVALDGGAHMGDELLPLQQSMASWRQENESKTIRYEDGHLLETEKNRREAAVLREKFLEGEQKKKEQKSKQSTPLHSSPVPPNHAHPQHTFQDVSDSIRNQKMETKRKCAESAKPEWSPAQRPRLCAGEGPRLHPPPNDPFGCWDLPAEAIRDFFPNLNSQLPDLSSAVDQCLAQIEPHPGGRALETPLQQPTATIALRQMVQVKGSSPPVDQFCSRQQQPAQLLVPREPMGVERCSAVLPTISSQTESARSFQPRSSGVEGGSRFQYMQTACHPQTFGQRAPMPQQTLLMSLPQNSPNVRWSTHQGQQPLYPGFHSGFQDAPYLLSQGRMGMGQPLLSSQMVSGGRQLAPHQNAIYSLVPLPQRAPNVSVYPSPSVAGLQPDLYHFSSGNANAFGFA